MIISNHENKFKYKILARQIFSQIGDIGIRDNLCKNKFSNHQEWQWSCRNDKEISQRKQKQQLHHYKNDSIGEYNT